MNELKIVLGSSSPRRSFLLKEFGFNFRVIKSDIDETAPSHLNGSRTAMHISKLKADDLLKQVSKDELLITADTIVWINNEMLGKPADKDDALVMLKKLSGKSHSVFTGVTLHCNEISETFFVETVVTFEKINDAELIKYIETFKPYDKAGAYGAQECLPADLNPCSEEEKTVLKDLNKQNLFRENLNAGKFNSIAMIKEISGSYFNVMGLPVTELIQRMKHIL